MVRPILRALGCAALLAAPLAAQDLAIECGKVLTMNGTDEIFSPGLILVEHGKISYVGPLKEVAEGVERVQLPSAWALPGLVDLHTHIHPGGGREINDMVRSVNPELRASASMRPNNRQMQRGLAAGVTTLFGIPGSGTNIGGFGMIYKLKTSQHFETAVLESVGGMKVAQDSNPARRAGNFAFGNSRASMGWIIENVCNRALAATREQRADPALRDLQRIMSRDLPVLIHTAGSSGVANTARMWHVKYGTRCVISHGSFNGWMVAQAIAAWGVRVNHGPRVLDFYSSRNGRINGTSAEYLKAGIPDFSLNTDSGVIAEEDFFLQGSMSARLGADSYQMLRALTIHPAITFGLDDRVGSLEVGKDADVVLYTADPIDPRTHVVRVWIDGQLEYEHTDAQEGL